MPQFLIAIAVLAAATGAFAQPVPAIESQQGFIESDGVKLFYEVQGRRPTMVLVHDGLLHRECWDAQWGLFAESHTVVRYDRRGYGRSQISDKSYSDVEDLDRLFEHLKIREASVVGASAGGSIAIEFAISRPHAVNRLILVGPIVSGMPFSEHFQARNHAAFRPLAEKWDIDATIANWVNDPFLIAAANKDAKTRLKTLLQANPQNLTRQVPPQKPAPVPALQRLGEIKIPTLILVGESDIADVHAHSGAIQAGIAGAKRVVVHNAGHLVYLERPDEFNRLVRDFTRR